MSNQKLHFFHAQNASRPVKTSAGEIAFFVYESAGTWLGAYATKDEKIAAALNALAEDPKSCVTKISRDEFVKCIEIKKKNAGSFSDSLVGSFAGLSDELISEFAGNVGAPVEAEPAPEAAEPDSTPLATAEAALQVGEVNQSEPEQPKAIAAE